MENFNLELVLCILPPLTLMFLVFQGKARATLFALVIGIFMAYYSGELSGFIMATFNIKYTSMTVMGTPIIEEFLKVLPVVAFAFLKKPDDTLLLEFAFSVGVGFAVTENLYFLTTGIFANSNMFEILFRCILGAVVHGGNTLMVGYGVSFVNKKRKLFLTGTFALYSVAVVIHSTHNIMSSYGVNYVFLIAPLLEIASFAALIIYARKKMSL